METRTYKNTNEKISILGYGNMRLPRINPEKQDIDEQAAQALIDYAYAHGVNYYDTAYVYHEQKSESFVGRALSKYPRESYYIATKMPGWLVKSMDDVDRMFNEQLARLQTDYIDFYLCHSLSAGGYKIYEQVDIYGYLKKKKEEGAIRHLGFSFHDKPEVLEQILDKHEWDFVQIQLNYLDWELQDAKRQYEILAERGIPCIVMEPVRGGALARLCDESVSILKEAAPDKSVASWAIRYAASLPNVLTVLSGMSTMEQVVDNVNTVTGFAPLSDAERETLSHALAAFRRNKLQPCTGCRYCMDCPSGVDIPLMFSIYNSYRLNEHKAGFLKAYEEAGSKQAKNCIQCGQCATHCPQSIEIPDRMQEIAALAEELGK
ncbi:MAG: 4Fe-4S dicluster domain-containing protein [Provencibacterium sp.]|nr:4Fe-4S dicluster domain-containing protein [Provencibacterium sp.]